MAEEQAYRRLKQMILRTELEPGTRLVHRNLAEKLGMSRNPIVLALRLLEQDGLVVNIPGLGAYVRTWNANELADLYQTRALLEGLACRLCAQRCNRVDLVVIESANEKFIEAIERKDVEATIQADVNFHESVVKGAHSPYLETLLGNLSIIHLSITVMMARSQESPFPQGHQPVMLHLPIVEALRKKDEDAAARAGEEHALCALEANLKWFEDNDETKKDKQQDVSKN